jgi:DNA-binding CsgD family transcriptional regulator
MTRDAELTPREIARVLNISVQRVHQQITRLRALGELPEKEKS